MEIIRHSTDFGRIYQVDQETYFPSVTTVLSLYQDPELIKFKESVGDDYFNHLGRIGAARGSIMHKYLELFLMQIQSGHSKDEALIFTQTNTPNDPELAGNDLKAWKTGKTLFYNFWYDGVLDQIQTVLENEIYLYATVNEFKVKGGYAGTADFVFIDKEGNLIIADFKTSKKPKDPQHIKGYYMQIAAYMFAYYQRSGKFPESGQIWIANELEPNIQKIKIHKSQWKEIFKAFLKLVGEWYNLNNNNLTLWKQKI